MSEQLNTPDAAAEQAPPDDYNEYVAWKTSQEEATAAEEAEDEDEPSEATAEPAAAESADDPDTSEVEQDDDDDTDPDDTGEGEGEKPKRKAGFQKRIDRLTREKRELEARLAAAEQPKPAEATKEEPKPEATGKPKAEDFDTYDAFTEALTDWKLAEKDRAQVAERAKAQAEAAHKAVLDNWNERAAAVKKANPDYDKALDAASDVTLPGYVQAALLESERGPEIAYHLAKNREVLERIVSLSPASAGREIGKIEARLEASGAAAAPATPKPALTKAPKPVKPVQGSTAGTAPSVYDESLAGDYNAWAARRRAELRRK